MNRELKVGDTVCVDITAAQQIPVDGYEVMVTHAIPDIWLAGEVVELRRDGRYEVDVIGPNEAGPARFVVTIAGIRAPRADGSCG
jgi:hypothetical protein